MISVNVAELKNNLSKYLKRVRAGEEIVVRDRNLPIARLAPFTDVDCTAEELALAAAGKLKLPEREMDWDAFWALADSEPYDPKLAARAREVVTEEREEREQSVLSGVRLKKKASRKTRAKR